MARRDARDLAMRMIYAEDLGGKLEPLKDGEMPDEENCLIAMDEFDRGYIDRVMAVFRENAAVIDETINGLSSDWSLNRISKVDLAILRLACCEIGHMNEVPLSVAINEAVELAKKYGTDQSSRFVNGVLGGYARKLTNA
ncbi:MAG: transcription antitermination factor NusB [Clostridia bacterium]|nr:transcription antitermination factor NusB [Clostridia bacterium]